MLLLQIHIIDGVHGAYAAYPVAMLVLVLLPLVRAA
jgi:hypothetical protein